MAESRWMAVSCIARYLCELSLFLTWCRCAFCHWPYHVYCHTRYTSACVICELKNYLLIYILKIVILLAWVRPVIEALTWVFRGTVYMCRISYQSVHVRANGTWQLDSNNNARDSRASLLVAGNLHSVILWNNNVQRDRPSAKTAELYTFRLITPEP